MANNYNYIPGFHFKVNFVGLMGLDFDARFREVSGLQAEIETEEVREGGENGLIHHLPKGVKFPNLVLKRALPTNFSPIIMWAEDAIYNFKINKNLVLVSLLNEKSNPVKSWVFVDAYPVKIQISDLNAGENSLVIETLEMAYRYSQSISLNMIGSFVANLALNLNPVKISF